MGIKPPKPNSYPSIGNADMRELHEQLTDEKHLRLAKETDDLIIAIIHKSMIPAQPHINLGAAMKIANSDEIIKLSEQIAKQQELPPTIFRSIPLLQLGVDGFHFLVFTESNNTSSLLPVGVLYISRFGYNANQINSDQFREAQDWLLFNKFHDVVSTMPRSPRISVVKPIGNISYIQLNRGYHPIYFTEFIPPSHAQELALSVFPRTAPKYLAGKPYIRYAKPLGGSDINLPGIGNPEEAEQIVKNQMISIAWALYDLHKILRKAGIEPQEIRELVNSVLFSGGDLMGLISPGGNIKNITLVTFRKNQEAINPNYNAFSTNSDFATTLYHFRTTLRVDATVIAIPLFEHWFTLDEFIEILKPTTNNSQTSRGRKPRRRKKKKR